MVGALIAVAAIARLAQLALGGWQVASLIAPLTDFASRAGRRQAFIGPLQTARSSPSPSDHDRVSDTLLMRGDRFRPPAKIPR